MMTYTALENWSLNDLSQARELKIIIKNKVEAEKIALINQKISQGEAVFIHFQNDKTPVEALVTHFENAEHLLFSPAYEFPLKNIDFLQNVPLKTLYLGLYAPKNISFKHLKTTSLESFHYEEGLGHKSQYAFINEQKNLQQLHLRGLDLSHVKPLSSLQDLFVRSSLKAESSLGEVFPNLKSLRLHGLSKLTDHSFVENLGFLEQIAINYNSHLKSFPRLKNPHLVRSIQMHACPYFSDIESLLFYENLEKLTLTSHDKPLNVTAQAFALLKNLPKLREVYTLWGRISAEKEKAINLIYKETNWANSGLVSQ